MAPVTWTHGEGCGFWGKGCDFGRGCGFWGERCGFGRGVVSVVRVWFWEGCGFEDGVVLL